MNNNDFLLELGTEELPPKLLKQLSKALGDNLIAQLNALNLVHNEVEIFATPRRLAVLVHGLQRQQDDQLIERKGPNVNAPEQAIAGFAKSCGVAKTDLSQKSFGKTDYYYFSQQKKGLKALDLLANAVDTAIKKIPIAKPMRWGDTDFSFARPVNWLVTLLDSEVVDATIMGLKSGNTTRGMRFNPEPEFSIANAADYQQILWDKAKIEVDFNKRKAIIRQQVMQVASECQANAVIDEGLLDEVCALVEHPQALSGKFDVQFLNVPKEALISAMKLHQKYFYMVDDNGELLPAFIAVANIESTNLSVIIKGNERVIRSRLTDAKFFWEQDKKTTLESRLSKLDSVLFMKSLGSMGDKAKRIEKLSAYIAEIIDANKTHSERAGLLCKTDLVTDMVGEFADLQGIMGGYYAKNDGEPETVYKAISEHYQPRFSGDSLPSTPEGLAVAIADKVDNIVGIYGIGQKPTGSKDPYALKRAGLGLLRMMIEAKLNINLQRLVIESVKWHKFDNGIHDEIYKFIVSRLRAYYQEKGIDKNIVKAVLKATHRTNQSTRTVYDWDLRITALNGFIQNESIQSLIEANKRIKNILKDTKAENMPNHNRENEFDTKLYKAIISTEDTFKTNKGNYQAIIKELLKLKPVIDDFFDNVMINDKDPELRQLRLFLITRVRKLFLNVADFAYLSK